jgi:hypothetical protein
MIKRLTFVGRHPGRPSDGFGPSWREEAMTELAAMPPDLRPARRLHCVVRPGAASSPWDGVALTWHPDEDSAARHDDWLAGHAPPSSIVDAPGSLAVPVAERVVSGAGWLEDLWRRDGPPVVVLIGLIEAANDLTREEFRDYWWDRHRPLADRLVPSEVSPIAYVHDYVLDGAGPQRERFPWSGIGEMYEHSLGTARRRGEWFDSEAALALIADEERFLLRSSRQVLVTDAEVIASRR